jgi:regulator of protease activity HflC (stomatin/prohibitin superfamily)
MSERIKFVVQALRSSLAGAANGVKSLFRAGAGGVEQVAAGRNGRRLVAVCLAGGAAYFLIGHPPLRKVAPGNMGIRINQLTGATTAVRDGAVFVLPGVHELRQVSLLDQVYRPARADQAPFQSIEGLALGVDLSVRYALDPARIVANARMLPADIGGAIVEPDVQGVIYKIFTRYTVREIYSSKRAEIQQAIETELKPRLAADGIVLRGMTIGKITLPEDYKAGMEKLLAEELETEKMRYTLELKEKQVRQTSLEADADKVRREKAAEAAGNEQIIAAKAQEQAMQHVLPFKQKQIEQRQLEAEAEKVARIKTSEGNAQARVIEAAGEAESRRKLADAEAYRQDVVGRVATAQLERDGAVITQNPLLIQKTMADKLSDKVSVIIAPAPTDGGFIGSALLDTGKGGKRALMQTAAVAGE